MAQLLKTAPACEHEFPIELKPQGNGYIIHADQLNCKLCGMEFVVPGRGGYASKLAVPLLPLAFAGQAQAKPEAAVPDKSPAKERPKPEPPDPSRGLPGTEMLSLTAELGIEAKAGCGCKGMAATMDRLGVEGCRQRAPELLLSVQANYAAWGWKDKLHAATTAAWKAAGLGVNPLDPVKSLVELAIDRAEAKAGS